MTTQTRDELEKEICNYFLDSGVSRELLPKVIEAFKECAEQGREFEEFFAPRHHATLNQFQKQYFAVLNAEAPKEKTQQMTKWDARKIFADSQSSPSLLEEAARILG